MILLGIGAGIGAVIRYIITIAGKKWAQTFPVATLIINTVGAFIAGVLATAMLPSTWSLILLTGFCGGFTTFSTYMTDTLVLFREHRWLSGCLYYLGTAILGVLAVLIGALVTRMMS